MRTRLLLFAALVSSLGFAPAPFPRSGRERPPNDLERLQGAWQVVEARQIGNRIAAYEGCTVRVAGARWSFYQKGDSTTPYHWKMTVNQRAAPATVDFEGVEGNQSSRAIYRFDGDTLTLSYTLEGGRPGRFDRDRDWFMLLKRADR